MTADQRLEPDPLLAPIAREIFTRYADGESIRQIRDDLNRRNIRTRRGLPFAYSSFAALLKNRKYIGEFKYKDVVIRDGMPAIIDKDLFERVQVRVNKNKFAPAKAKAREEFLLTTKLFCGNCGRSMVGESGTSRTGTVYYYYKCRGAKKLKDCKKKAAKKEWIENEVVRHTVAMVMDDVVMERLIDRLVEFQSEETTDVKILSKELTDVQRGIDNMLDAIQAGVVTDSTKQRLVELEERKKDVEVSLAKAKLKHPVLTREQISMFLYRFRKLDTTKFENRQKLIDCFVNAVYLYDDKMVLTFNFRDGSKTISLSEVEGSDLIGDAPPQTSIYIEVFF